MREKDYVVIIGSANIDVAGYSHESLNYADSNPGKIKFTPGGVGRNIAQNLALLGNKAWLLSAVGSDFYGQSLLTQTNQSGVYVDKCLIVPGENTSSYLSLLDNTGEMLVAINDMNISNAITAEYLAQHREFIQRAKVIVADCNISEEALAWILDNAANVPVFVDPVSAWKCVKVRDRLNQIHTLKPNRLEAETLSGIALSGCEDVAKVAAWFHQHGLNRLVLSMGGDGVYYSDIVLLGVSRTSKTPLSMYLAYQGYKVANVPLAHGMEPPKSIYEVDPMRLFGRFRPRPTSPSGSPYSAMRRQIGRAHV